LSEYDDLPDDPELAFVYLVKRYTSELEDFMDGNRYSDRYEYCMKYLVKVTSAAKAFELDILTEWRIFDIDNTLEFNYRFLEFRSDVDHYVNYIDVKNARKNNANSVRLNQQEKETLLGYVEKIRQIIASSGLPDERKEKLYRVLSELALEINRDRTRFQRISELVMNYSGVSKYAADEAAMPWVNAAAKLILSLYGKIYDAKQDELQRLPQPEARKKLPPPNKPTQPESSGGALDDEIPF
jgi:hypothetical protein